MAKRTFWILNFATTCFLSLIFIVFAYQTIFLRSSDKDMIVVPFIIVIFFYLWALTFLFYRKIYKWDKHQQQSFYSITFPVTGLSFFILFNLGQSIIDQHQEFSFIEILAATACALNIVTFCCGLITKE